MKITLILICMLFAGVAKAGVDTTYELKKLSSSKVENIQIVVTRDTGKIEEIKIIDTAFGDERGKITLSDVDIYNLNLLSQTSLANHYLIDAGFFTLKNWQVLATQKGNTIELIPVYDTNGAHLIMIVFYVFTFLICFLAVMGSKPFFKRMGWALFIILFIVITIPSIVAYADHVFPFPFTSYFSFQPEMLLALAFTFIGSKVPLLLSKTRFKKAHTN